MVTVAFGQIAFYIAYSWNDLTGGYDGLRGFTRAPMQPRLHHHRHRQQRHRLLLFPAGRVRRCDRRCKACCSPPRSAAPCWPSARTNGAPASWASRSSGISGCRSRSPAALPRWPASLYALLNNFADPLGLHYSLSGEIVIMTVMGGMRAFWGPLVGAALFVVLQDYISSMTVNWMSFVGLIFVLVVLFFPRGLLGMLQARSAQYDACPTFA